MAPANEEDDAHMSENRRHQVVVIGSGFGGLFATRPSSAQTSMSR